MTAPITPAAHGGADTTTSAADALPSGHWTDYTREQHADNVRTATTGYTPQPRGVHTFAWASTGQTEFHAAAARRNATGRVEPRGGTLLARATCADVIAERVSAILRRLVDTFDPPRRGDAPPAEEAECPAWVHKKAGLWFHHALPVAFALCDDDGARLAYVECGPEVAFFLGNALAALQSEIHAEHAAARASVDTGGPAVVAGCRVEKRAGPLAVLGDYADRRRRPRRPAAPPSEPARLDVVRGAPLRRPLGRNPRLFSATTGNLS
jgi:hypothetical protein